MLWDSYAALGLVHTLTPTASGGVEPVPAEAGHLNSDPHTEKSGIPRGFGKIIRDGSGNVVQIEENVESVLPLEEMRAESSGVIKGELLT